MQTTILKLINVFIVNIVFIGVFLVVFSVKIGLPAVRRGFDTVFSSLISLVCVLLL